MAVTFRAESHLIGSGSTKDPGEPTGTAQGDALLGIILCAAAGNPGLPAGWTTLYSGSLSSAAWAVGYFIRGASAATTAFTMTGTVYREIRIYALQGGGGKITLDSQSASGSTSAGSTAAPNPPATVAVAAASLAVCGGFNYGASGGAVWVAPAGYTIRGDNTAANDSVFATKTLSASGSEDPAIFTTNITPGSGNLWNGFTVTFTETTTTFMEPGGDATFDFSLWTANTSNVATIVTDFVHGSHVKSIQVPAVGSVTTLRRTGAGTTGRQSQYLYLVALPSGANAKCFGVRDNTQAENVMVRLTSAGVLQLFNAIAGGTQIGSDGSTLITGTWYRLTICWNVTSTSVNEYRVYLNGVLDISASNVSVNSVVIAETVFGRHGDAALDFRVSDIYRDDSSSASDIATDVWSTAKRPNANGTTNNFSTQIGAGGSGYGSGHSPQVNERALSTTNGWSMVGAGSAVTEEYAVESAATGDINISTATLIDYMGWVYASSLAGETASIVVGGSSSSIALTSANTAFLKAKGGTAYPGGGTDIGIITDTSLTTVSLYECGLMFAYTPALPGPPPNLSGMNSSMQGNS